MVTVTRGAVHQRADIEVEHHIVVDGVKLLRATNGRYYAESGRQPGRLWFLTGFSCQCPGFVHRQTCRHHRALMQALGWIDGAPDPESAGKSLPPDELASCPTCHGSGSECGTVSTGRSWTYASVTCATCHGTGTAVAA